MSSFIGRVIFASTAIMPVALIAYMLTMSLAWAFIVLYSIVLFWSCIENFKLRCDELEFEIEKIEKLKFTEAPMHFWPYYVNILFWLNGYYFYLANGKTIIVSKRKDLSDDVKLRYIYPGVFVL